MKKILNVTIIIASVILLFSCGQNAGTQLSRLDELKLEYDQIGAQHNLKLGEMLSEYKAHTEIRTLQECQNLADNYFADTKNVAQSILNMISDQGRLRKSTLSADVIDALADSIDVFAKHRDVFDSIRVIADSQLDVRDKIEKLEEIYLLVDNTIEDEVERESVFNGLSTTIHSLEYWNDNFDEWQQTLTGTLSKTTLGIVGIIGITDGVGAVIGTFEGIRDTYKGQEERFKIIAGRIVGEAAKSSVYAALAILL